MSAQAALLAPLSPRAALWTGTLLSKHSHGQEGEARKLTLGHGELRAISCDLWLKLYAEAQEFPLSDDATLTPGELDEEKVRFHDQIETRERMKGTSAAVEAAREGVAAVLGDQTTDELVEMMHRREDAIDNLIARSVALDKPYRVYGCGYGEDYWKSAGMQYDPIDDEHVDEGIIALESCTREEVEALELAGRFRAAERDLAGELASTAASCGDAVRAERLLRHYRDLVAAGPDPDPTELQHIDASRAALAPIAAFCIAAAASGDGTYPPLVLVSDDGSGGASAPVGREALASLRGRLSALLEGPAAEQCGGQLQELKEAYRVPPNPPLTPSQIEVAKSDLVASLEERLEARALADAVEANFTALDKATDGLAGAVRGALRGHDAILEELAVRIAALDPAVEQFACRFFAFEPPEAAGGPPALAAVEERLQAHALLASMDLAEAAAAGAEGDVPVPVPCGLVGRLAEFLQAPELEEALGQCAEAAGGGGDDDEEDPELCTWEAAGDSMPAELDPVA